MHFFEVYRFRYLLSNFDMLIFVYYQSNDLSAVTLNSYIPLVIKKTRYSGEISFFNYVSYRLN